MLEFLSSNQGAGNAGKLLKVDTDGSVITAEVAGATVDDALSTTSTNPVQNKVITEELLTTEDKVEYLENGLSETETHQRTEIPYDHRSISNLYTTSTFSGWGTGIGSLDRISKVIIPFKTRSNEYPVTKAKVEIWRLNSPITDDDFGSDSQNWPYIGSKLEKLATKEIVFDEALPELTDQEIEFILDEPVINNDRKVLIVDFQANNCIDYGFNNLVISPSPAASGYMPGAWWNSHTNSTVGDYMNFLDTIAGNPTGTGNLSGGSLAERDLEAQNHYLMPACKIIAIYDDIEKILFDPSRVDALEDQLYDEFSHIEEHVYHNKPVNKPYASSSFAGWYGSVGRPAHIGYVDIPFKTRVDCPVTSINLKIYKLTRDITIDDFDYDEANDTYTGPFVSDFLVKVYEDNKTFETPLPEGTNQVIHFDLSEQIDNPENLQYIVGYECNNPITGGCNTNTTNKPWGDESYGPWIHYCTWNSSLERNSTTIDMSILDQEHKKFNLVGNSYNYETSGTYYSFAGKIGWLETVVERYISSEPDGKVGTIVQGVLDEMEITERLDAATAAAQLVEEAELPVYQGNSPIDLTDPEAVYSTFNPNSSFNGETQPIGKIPANVKIGGFRIPLQIRENIADPTLYRKANKAIIRLFASDSYSETGGDVGVIEWPDLNPVMVREKVIDIDLDLDDPNKISGIYNFFFDEPFYNTENKVLYLFVAINGRYMRTRVNGSANVLHTYINTHDGTEYAAQGQGVTLFSFYCAVSDCDVLSATSYSALYHRMWTDPQVFAYSIVDKLETYVASDMFNEWVDERTESTIAQDIDEYMSTYVPPLVPDCEVRLPKKIYAVKGDKLQLFYDGMIKGFNPSYTHDITVRCSKGSNYTRYWEYTPTAADVGHSYSFQLIVRNFQGQYISSGTTTIEVLDVPDYSVAPTYNMLCFGDSLTGAGKWCSEGMRRLVGTDLTATGPKPMPALYGIDIVLNETPSWISSSDIGTTWKDNNNKNWLLESYKNNGLNIRFGRGSGNTDLMENITLPTSLTRTSPARTIAAGDIASVNWETVGLSLSSYGRKHNTNNTYTVYHEGYGGWTWGSFLDDGRTSTDLGIFVTVDHTVTWDLDTVQHSEWVDNLNRNWKLENIQDNVIKFDRGSGNTESSATAPLPTSLTCASLSLSIAQSEITSSVWEAGNPFWNELTQQVDFLTHAAERGHAPADIVSILLTWNGGAPSDTHFDYQSKIQTHIENATTLIRDIHRDLPNAKVICMGIQRSSVTGGAGGSYGADGSYSDCWGTVYYSFDYNQALENLVTNEEFGQYCYYGDTKSQFDTEYLMPYNNVAVNTRSDITERRGSNGVHPSDAGYYAIGDAYFRTLVKVLNDIHS